MTATLPYAWHGEGSPDSSPPLVLIAGLGAKGTSWEPFLSEARQRHRVLTFDNRGSGQAPALPGSARIADMAGDAIRLLDELGVERMALVGRSMGGMIAQELALLIPERIARLVLVSTTGRVDAHLREVFLTWAQLAEAGVAAELRHRTSLLWCLGRESLAAGGAARSYLDARARSDRPSDYARQARACAEHDVLAKLEALRCPTLVIGGDDDRLTPARHAEELTSAISGGAPVAISGGAPVAISGGAPVAIPGCARVAIPGVGHLAYLEAPARFAAEVLGFLEGMHPCPRSTTRS